MRSLAYLLKDLNYFYLIPLKLTKISGCATTKISYLA